jgi:anti-sigma regulatory factor (Ser/Thr protein kinase)
MQTGYPAMHLVNHEPVISPRLSAVTGFVHRAFFYGDQSEWVDGLVPFIREGFASDEPVLVAVATERIELLRDELGSDASMLDFIAMEAVGKNPGRIISAWHDFVDHHPDRRVRGIGEPVWAGRRPDEVVECQHHEQLLNVAFDGLDFELVCPYDMSALEEDVVREAFRSHPYTGNDTVESNPTFTLDIDNRAQLTPPPSDVRTFEFNRGSLREVRKMVGDHAVELINDPTRVDHLMLAVSEAATNSVLYGGGGVLTVWSEASRLICDISDTGRLTDPLVGRRRPPPDAPRGRGVWIVHQMCDLVQIRTADEGTTVRLAMEFGTS